MFDTKIEEKYKGESGRYLLMVMCLCVGQMLAICHTYPSNCRNIGYVDRIIKSILIWENIYFSPSNIYILFFIKILMLICRPYDILFAYTLQTCVSA